MRILAQYAKTEDEGRRVLDVGREVSACFFSFMTRSPRGDRGGQEIGGRGVPGPIASMVECIEFDPDQADHVISAAEV